MTTTIHGFELVKEQNIPEIFTNAQLYRHVKTGAELLSLINDDENKSFDITFKTPPSDSTGVAHILEHSVLCGSANYPVKKPFVELLKGSFKTFLNAFTGATETYYPVASTNLRDFYNLVDVYLDAALYPRLTPEIFQQEGWHYELEDRDGPLVYKGVVFNEMKGAFSSPDTVLSEYATHALFPDNIIGVCSGGHPHVIPELTYEGLKGFHEYFYHPSNARIMFYGDDDPTERLRRLDAVLSAFERREIDTHVPLQPRFDAPRRETHPYAAGESEIKDGKGGMMSMGWIISDTIDPETSITLSMLGHILTGTPASPLRKALTDSGLAEAVSGGVGEAQQSTFGLRLKGMAPADADKLEAIALETLERLAKEGIDPETIAASLNTMEFALRENNSGSFPRGLSTMFQAMSAWLYGGDPIDALAFEKPLNAVKEHAKSDRFFPDLVAKLLVKNTHRTTVVLTPDTELTQRDADDERARLNAVREGMSESHIDAIIAATRELKRLQETPDSEEELACLPRLTLADLDPKIKTIPIAETKLQNVPVFTHDLPTNGILYLDLGFDMHRLPADLLPYVSLFGRALLQTGAAGQDFVQLSQRIGSRTGGIGRSSLTSPVRDSETCTSWLFLRGKAVPDQAGDLLSILHDVLTAAHLDNRERLQQMALEEKARMESSLAGSGHSYVDARLRAQFTESAWAGEQMGGIAYLFFLRGLVDRIENDWPSVQATLERMREILLNRAGMLCNVTLDDAATQAFLPKLDGFLAGLPLGTAQPAVWDWSTAAISEGLTFPGQVNYVGKGANIFDLGYQIHGSSMVISKTLRTGYLWDKIRVEGGAYGGFCSFDHLSGVFSFCSYRDPNLIGTLNNYDGAAPYLRALTLSDAELTRSIIGTVSDLDSYQLPDAKGWTSLVRMLIGETDETRQRRRDEVLSTTLRDFNAFADVLAQFNNAGRVVVLGSPEAIAGANAERPGLLTVTEVL